MRHREIMHRQRASHRAMGVTAIAAAAAAVLAGCSAGPAELGRSVAAAPTSATEPATPSEDVVTVSGVGTAEVVPDAARITIGVEVSESSVASAFETASERADAVIAALRDADVADDDIRTTAIDVRPQRERPEEPGAVADITGYVVRNALSVTVGDVDGVGVVLAAAVEAGGDATRVERFELVVTDDAAARETARQAAFEDARTSAAAFADLADRSLGELHTLTERSAVSPGPVPVEETADVAVPPVVAGTLTVSVSIRASWRLE